MSSDSIIKNKNKDEMFKRLIDIQKELEIRKALYTEFDEIILELEKQGWTNFIDTESATEYFIKDQTEGGIKNAIFTTAFTRRLDLKSRKAK